MEKYLLTAHDVIDEWRDIKKIIDNTNDCNLLDMSCDIANSPNKFYGLYVYHFLIEATKESYDVVVDELYKLIND